MGVERGGSTSTLHPPQSPALFACPYLATSLYKSTKPIQVLTV